MIARAPPPYYWPAVAYISGACAVAVLQKEPQNESIKCVQCMQYMEALHANCLYSFASKQDPYVHAQSEV